MRRLGTCVVVLWSAIGQAQPADQKADETPVQEIAPEEPVQPTPPAPTPAPATPPPAAPAMNHFATMDEVIIPTSFLRFGINFFGDTSFTLTSPGSPVSSFSIETLGVRLLGQLSPSLDALGELAFENKGEGPLADVEQLAIRWRSSSGMLDVGRFHTDIGYWNTAYHHGRWLQMTVERPHVVRFEDDGGLVPVHWVGGSYTLGKKDSPIAAVFAVGNGRGNIVDDVRVGSDTNEAKGVLSKVRFRSGDGEFGFGAMYDLIAKADAMIRPALPNQKIHELMGNLYFVNRGPRLTIIAEGYVFRHQAAGQSWMTYGGFAQVGYKLGGIVTPYLAFDGVRGADKDPYFTPDPMMSEHRDLVEGLGGVRIDVSAWSALKLETHVEHPLASGEPNEYEGILNWSFGL
jgi:hypothetical protein